jgi:hypothetical protein
MITGTVWGLTLIAVGLVATFAATQVFLAALFPARFATVRRVLRVSPRFSTVAGLLTLLLALGLGKAVGGKFELGGAVLAIGAVLAALFGMGAVAAELGDRLPSSGAAAAPWRALVRGSIACSLVSLLPLAGWFVFFPLLLGAGFGAWMLSLVAADRYATPAPLPPAVPAPRAVPAATEEPAEVGV